MTTMSSLRTTLVALVALAIAAFPAAGVGALGVSSEASHVLAQADCCPDGEACEQHAKDHAENHMNDCGKLGGCGCGCLGLTAVLTTAPGALSSPMPLLKTVRVAGSAMSPAYFPPSPPPRV